MNERGGPAVRSFAVRRLLLSALVGLSACAHDGNGAPANGPKPLPEAAEIIDRQREEPGRAERRYEEGALAIAFSVDSPEERRKSLQALATAVGLSKVPPPPPRLDVFVTAVKKWAAALATEELEIEQGQTSTGALSWSPPRAVWSVTVREKEALLVTPSGGRAKRTRTLFFAPPATFSDQRRPGDNLLPAMLAGATPEALLFLQEGQPTLDNDPGDKLKNRAMAVVLGHLRERELPEAAQALHVDRALAHDGLLEVASPDAPPNPPPPLKLENVAAILWVQPVENRFVDYVVPLSP